MEEIVEATIIAIVISPVIAVLVSDQISMCLWRIEAFDSESSSGVL